MLSGLRRNPVRNPSESAFVVELKRRRLPVASLATTIAQPDHIAAYVLPARAAQILFVSGAPIRAVPEAHSSCLKLAADDERLVVGALRSLLDVVVEPVQPVCVAGRMVASRPAPPSLVKTEIATKVTSPR